MSRRTKNYPNPHSLPHDSRLLMWCAWQLQKLIDQGYATIGLKDEFGNRIKRIQDGYQMDYVESAWKAYAGTLFDFDDGEIEFTIACLKQDYEIEEDTGAILQALKRPVTLAPTNTKH